MNTILENLPIMDLWQYEKIIGRGSFGTVYLAFKVIGSQKLYSAIKHISIPTEEQVYEIKRAFGTNTFAINNYCKSIVDDIQNEINYLYTLKGTSNIVSYEDCHIIKKDNNFGWDVLIRMEYLEKFEDRLKFLLIKVSEVLKIGINICSALEICHNKNIIHRDIKDANLFYSKNNENYKIGDFGVSKSLTEFGEAHTKIGSLAYMAPEVFSGSAYDFKSDTYSLALVLYKLLNDGRAPFMPYFPEQYEYNENEISIRKRMSDFPLPKPRNSNSIIWGVIKKALEFNPDNRYKSTTEFLHELINLQETLSIHELDMIIQDNSNIKYNLLEKDINLTYKQTMDIDLDQTELINLDEKHPNMSYHEKIENPEGMVQKNENGKFTKKDEEGVTVLRGFARNIRKYDVYQTKMKKWWNSLISKQPFYFSNKKHLFHLYSNENTQKCNEIEIQGNTYVGTLFENNEVEVIGVYQKNGILLCKKILNLTSSVSIKAEQGIQSIYIKIITGVLLLSITCSVYFVYSLDWDFIKFQIEIAITKLVMSCILVFGIYFLAKIVFHKKEKDYF